MADSGSSVATPFKSAFAQIRAAAASCSWFVAFRRDGAARRDRNRSQPPAFDTRRDIHGVDWRARSRTVFARSRPGALLEMLGDRVGNESGPDRLHVPVATAALLMSIEALRHDQVQVILSARHRHVK
jgi:hypothetical protein